MPSELSFDKAKDARAVAIVRGGAQDGRILYLHTDAKPKPCAGAGREVDNPVKYMKDLKHIKPSERAKVMSELMEGVKTGKPVESADDKVKKVYDEMSEDTAKDNSITLPDESLFQVIPNPDSNCREVLWVAGMSGSGKSYFAKNYAESYKKIYPDREIYLVSRLDKDETLDNMKIGKPKRISLQSIFDDPPDISEFEKCLVIFDDVLESLKGNQLKIIQNIIDTIATQGRHTVTSMLICSHTLSNYKSTRQILMECHYIVVYPNSTAFKPMKYVLENYAGMTKEQVHDIKKLGRWCAIYKMFPPYIVSAHKASLLHQ